MRTPRSLLLCTAAIASVAGCGARTALTDSLASGGAGDGSQGEGGGGNDGGPRGQNPAVNLDVNGDSLAPTLLFDASNTAHLLYSFSELNTGVFPYGARYAECPGNCEVLSSWRFATLHVQAMVSSLVLDSQGRPRFLFTQPPSGPNAEVPGNLILASCDMNCTAASSWTLTTIFKAFYCTVGSGDIPQGAPLAIDSTGRLWATFASSYAELTVASCEDHCSDAASWAATPYALEASDLGIGSLCPRDASMDDRGVLHVTAFSQLCGGLFMYIELSRGATSLGVYTIPASFGFPTRMRVDPVGRPRILHQQAGTPFLDGSSAIVYSSCDSDCATGGTWSSVTIPVPGGTATPGDFVLDGTGTPHVAYASPSFSAIEKTGESQALEYAAQSAASDGGAFGAWQFATVQSSSVLEADTPMLGSENNRDGLPQLVMGPTSIGLDTSGKIHFAFDVSKGCFDFGNGCPDGLRYASLAE
jgi:hypothetical protein